MADDRRTRSALRWKEIQTIASISRDDPRVGEIRRLTIATSAKTITALRLGCHGEVCIAAYRQTKCARIVDAGSQIEVAHTSS